MQTASSTEVKNHFGEYLEKAIREPVAITKTGRNSAVILSYEEYLRLRDLEDMYWALKAEQAEKSGYASVAETMAFLNEMNQANETA